MCQNAGIFTLKDAFISASMLKGLNVLFSFIHNFINESYQNTASNRLFTYSSLQFLFHDPAKIRNF